MSPDDGVRNVFWYYPELKGGIRAVMQHKVAKRPVLEVEDGLRLRLKNEAESVCSSWKKALL